MCTKHGRLERRAVPASLGHAGVTLIELVVVIVIVGILGAVAMSSGSHIVEQARFDDTKEELEDLAYALAGDPDLKNNGVRADFGYVGDVGAMPPQLDALYANPGSYATWKGPYVGNRIEQIAADYKTDAWNTAYSYGGGVTITSTGSGSSIIRRVAGSVGDLLCNGVSGNILDLDGSPPDGLYRDSITVGLTVPNGAGGTVTRIAGVGWGGYFTLDSVPIGSHKLQIVYAPAADTLSRFVCVVPGSSVYGQYRLNGDYWVGSSTAPTTSLLGHWKLDETGGTTAFDASGFARHGTLHNMNPGTDWVSGKLDGALDFDGSNDYVQVPHSDSLNGGAELTYAAWIYPHGWSNVMNIISKSVHGGGSGRAQMGIFSEGGLLKGRAETVAGRMEISTTLPAEDAWSHVALVFDSTSLKLYVNGAEATGMSFGATALVQTTDPLNFSKRVGSDQYYFDGLMDDIRVYQRALAAPEVQALYGMGT